MNNWKELHIGNEVNILSGHPFDSKKFNTDKEGKPLIRIRDILESSISTYFSGSYSDTFLIKKEDILVGMDGDFHVAKWNNIDALLNQRILKVHQKKGAKIDIDYFYYFLQPFLKKVHDITAATTVKHLSTFDIKRAKRRFPEVKHQQKIAKILNTIDAVIEKTENAITKYQAIKKGMMHDLFTRGIDINTGQLRSSYNDAPELYKESALGMIPKDWGLESLSELTNLITDGAHFSPIPQEDGLPIGNVKDMTPYGFNYDKCTLILKDTFELLERQNCSPKKGDVLLSKDGTIGRVILFNDNRPIVLLSSIAIIRTNELITGKYLSLLLQSFYFDKELFKLVSGSALKRITLKDIQKINIPYPTDKKEQLIIFNKLKAINDLIQKEQKTLAKNQNIKKGLMQDLLTGKVEVKV